MSQNNTALSALNCTFTNNNALRDGGAILVVVRAMPDAFGNHEVPLSVGILFHDFYEKVVELCLRNNIFPLEGNFIPRPCIITV